jgi:AraC-like DNA-binding protein
MNHSAYILFTKTSDHNIDTMINECNSDSSFKKSQYSELIKNNIMERILITLSECDRYDQIFKDTYANHDIKDRGERILQFMNEHYATITLEELAKKFGYSPQQIRRIIKKHSGYSFITALQHKRINRALHLLQSTDLSIKEIAEMVGLESPEYFSRRFKYERGVTPTEYRKNIQNKNKV